jgi:dolichyl-diphosphooligosaccharide--protein glycosyltransferase
MRAARTEPALAGASGRDIRLMRRVEFKPAMSNWRDRVNEDSDFGVVTAWLDAYYHYVALALLAAFALWNRVRNWENFVVDGEVLFRANDPWYHLRSVQYVVDNYPATMPFDPWTYFPFGTSSGQFGTLFDQIMATIALVVGLGNPSDELVRQVVLFAPVVFGVATLVPTYLIGRRLGGRAGGVISAAVVAFGAGSLLSSSVAGASDHHVAEALFQALGVLGVMVAIGVAEREKPVWELLAAREVDALRRPLAWAAVGGLGIAAYLWVWPPGVLLLGILGVFFLLHLGFEYARGNSPEHAALAGAVSLGTAGVLQLGSTRVLDISATSRSLLQPGLALAVAVGCVFVAWLARVWDSRDGPAAAFPVALVAIVAAVAGLAAVVVPDTFGFFLTQVDRIFGFLAPTTGAATTIGEAQPGSLGDIFGGYKLAAVTALAGALILLGKQVLNDDPGGEGLLVVVWSAFIVAASLTQARFGYYLAVPVAALTGATVGFVGRYLRSTGETVEIETYQVLTVASVLVLVVAPLVFVGTATTTTVADRASNPGGVVGWQDGLNWADENLPAQGQYANPDGEPIEYLGTFAATEDFDYPEGAYGVMSWWDYGHWITTQAETIPNANPFQQGLTDAARFLTAGNESTAGSVLADVSEDDAETRYVMVDWKMAETESLPPVRGKFFAPSQLAPNASRDEFFSRMLDRNERTRGIIQSTVFMRHKQPYYDSMLARLYLYHGSAVSPEPVVVDWQGSERPSPTGGTLTQPPPGGAAESLKLFENLSAARSFVEEDGTAQLGGFGPYPTERVPALEHYRLVHMSNTSALQSGGYQQGLVRTIRQTGLTQKLGGVNSSQGAINFLFQNTPTWTKTFERVPGATVEGTGPANATLRLRVPMRPANGNEFVYRQRVRTDDDGTFSTTLPYATTEYDQWGTAEGYTNVSVRAAGPYTITSAATLNDSQFLVRERAQFNVSEAAVVGERTDPITVDLETQVLGEAGSQNDSADEATNDTAGDTSGSETDGTSDGGTNTTTDGTSNTTTAVSPAGVAAPVRE